jgi:hypothetical protein
MGWTMVALAAVQAVSSIQQGRMAEKEANLNATIMEGQAGLIDVQKDIEKAQYQRAQGKAMSSSFASMAGQGIMPSGSPMAVLLDTQTQMELDKAIGQFNLEQQKRYKMEEANAYRRQGKMAKQQGYMGAFTSMLQGASNYAMYKGMANKPTTSFDTSAGATRASSMGNQLVYGRR